jgi:hypothetical protein
VALLGSPGYETSQFIGVCCQEGRATELISQTDAQQEVRRPGGCSVPRPRQRVRPLLIHAERERAAADGGVDFQIRMAAPSNRVSRRKDVLARRPRRGPSRDVIENSVELDGCEAARGQSLERRGSTADDPRTRPTDHGTRARPAGWLRSHQFSGQPPVAMIVSIDPVPNRFATAPFATRTPKLRDKIAVRGSPLRGSAGPKRERRCEC